MLKDTARVVWLAKSCCWCRRGNEVVGAVDGGVVVAGRALNVNGDGIWKRRLVWGLRVVIRGGLRWGLKERDGGWSESGGYTVTKNEVAVGDCD